MLADIILKDKVFTWLYLLGSVLVVGGFILVNCDKHFARLMGHLFQRAKRRLLNNY